MEEGASSLFFLAVLLLAPTVDASLNAIYVFGDSTVDVGNNNYLPNVSANAKANFPHYGIDFLNSTPTGRFSNGYNTADLLAMLLGFPMSPPAFLSLTQHNFTKQMFKGINFASAGSGVLDDTGPLTVGQVINLRAQIRYFANVSRQMSKLMGPAAAKDYLSRCLFLISSGSNDMFEYSIFPKFPNDTVFLFNLTSTYNDELRALYDLGARKFGVVSVPLLGCCPSQRARNTSGGCYEQLNELSRKFYPAIGAVLQELHFELPEMKYALGNAYAMVADIFKNPVPFKFKELKNACCGSGNFSGQSHCSPTLSCCANRTEYLFFDWFHPTQRASEIAAQTLYSAGQEYVTPINFSKLAEYDS